MKNVVEMLLRKHMGPRTEGTPEIVERLNRSIVCTVAEAVLDVILDPTAESFVDFDAEFTFGKERLIEVTFFGRATHTAEQIAKAFKELSGVSVNVMVWECCSEYECDGTE